MLLDQAGKKKNETSEKTLISRKACVVRELTRGPRLARRGGVSLLIQQDHSHSRAWFGESASSIVLIHSTLLREDSVPHPHPPQKSSAWVNPEPKC